MSFTPTDYVGHEIFHDETPLGAVQFYVVEVYLRNGTVLKFLQTEEGAGNIRTALLREDQDEFAQLVGFSFDADGWYLLNAEYMHIRRSSVDTLKIYPTIRQVTMMNVTDTSGSGNC